MLVRNSLQEIRKKRGISAADLAHRVGVSRQTIYAIEDGAFIPNTTVSLQLSRALEVTEEQIFSIAVDQAPEPIHADLLPVSEVNKGQAVRLCRVNQRVIAVPVSYLPAYLPPADGVIESRKKFSVCVKSPVQVPNDEKRLLVAGCDPALLLLQDALRPSGIEMISVPAGCRVALQWLKQGRVHAAG